MRDIVRPDGFAIGLFLFGFVLFFLPLLVMPGVIAMVSALAYWLTMMAVRAASRFRL